MHDAWRHGYKRPCIVLPCGGGKSIIAADMAKRATDNGKRVLFLVHRQELCEQITDTFDGYGVDMRLCTVGMVQTITRRLSALPAPDLIITDENHHCLASSYKRIYEKFNCWCVGVTATPVRLNGGGLGDVNDKLVIGISAKELIKRKCLAPYDYYAPPVADLSGLRSRNGDYAAEDVEAALNKSCVYGDIIKYYRNLSDGMQAICYCATVNHSMITAQEFNDAGVPAAHIDGNTPKPDRRDIIQRFRNGNIKILCNVDLISEGFDVPDCTTSILLRPTKSLTLYIQQAMRCMRYKAGKRAVIIDHVGNVHRHGLPDAERTWTLDPKPVSKKQNTVKVRQCTECFFTHEPAPVCPNCGYVYPKTQREVKEQHDAELRKVVGDYKTPDQCRSIQELYAYAKIKGYKAGYAYVQAVLRGWLK